MRVVAVLLILASLGLSCPGCGGKPDPSKSEDFVDTTDPSAVVDQMDPPPEGSVPKSAKP